MNGEPSSGQTGAPQTTAADETSSAPSEDDAGPTPDSFLAELARIPSRTDLPSSAPVPRPGETVGRFVVREELGRGGMGVVYTATDPTLGREVALKVLVTTDERRRKRLLREARAAAALGHAGVVAIYDVGEDAGRAFIAMERVHGETLRALLDARPNAARALPQVEARRIARDLARALAKAHARGLVHRDLKPENVIIEGDGRVVLLDFGLVKATVAEEDPVALTTEDGAILGTPSYMSPEQARGQAVDARSDVFSFGVMLYEMSTGRRPFVGKNAAAVFLAIDREEPRPPSEIAPGIDPTLERVALVCLRKDPSARYANAGVIAGELAHDGEAKTKRVPLATLAVVVVIVLGFVVVVARSWRTPNAEQAPASLSSTSARPVDAERAAPIAVTDLPSPLSQDAEAVKAYRAGLVAFRVGEAFGRDFQRAVTLDPSLAAAHVQLAAVGMAQHVDGVRESYHKARENSAALSPRDRALLDAIEPVVQREPADWAEANRRIEAALAERPGDAQLWYLLALGRGNFDDYDKAAEHAKRAATLDPGFSLAIGGLAIFEAYRGRFVEAHRAIDRCLEVTPASTSCLLLRARLEGYAGRCEAMESTARQMIAKGASPHVSYPLLADAIASRGEPSPTVQEALHRAAKEVDALPRATADRVRDRVIAAGFLRAAMLGGDFDDALAHARPLGQRLEGSAWRDDHGFVARAVAEILFETGKSAEAGKVALDYLDRQSAWEADPSAEDFAMAHDATPALLVVGRRAGVISREGLAARRKAWLAAWSSRVTPVARSFLWLHGFAATTSDVEDAEAALVALATHPPLPPYVPQTMVGASAGLAFLLGGRLDEAKQWLERAAGTCAALSFPIEHTRAHLWLGRAREASGDVPGACAAWKTVLDRWGRAKPRSVTADEARERRSRLGCDP